jgi:hypothetical protein
MSAKNKRSKKPERTPYQGRVTPRKADAAMAETAEIPGPRVTEYNTIIVVPVFDYGEAGPPSGSRGRYDVVFVLGIPGVSGVATSLNFDAMLADGNSLLEGPGLQVDLETLDDSAWNVARIVPNQQHRLAQIRLTVTADNFVAAEKEAYDEVMPVLSRIAFEADTPVEVTAVLMTEQATQIRSAGGTIIGTVQSAPEVTGLMTPELRPFLAAYREGLNSNSPLYQALSFYKVVEGVTTFRTKRSRGASKNGGVVEPDPLSKLIPANLNDLPDMTVWARGVFTPYLGKTFAEIKESVSNTIRNAIAHLTPGRGIRVADYLEDIQACRDITPILRYMARALIRDELAELVSRPAPLSPAQKAEPAST